MLLRGVQGKIHLSTNCKPVLGDYPPPPPGCQAVLRFMTTILKRVKEQVQEHIPMVTKKFEEESNKPPITLLVLFRFFHENRGFFQGYK
jgi:hypothetical protein